MTKISSSIQATPISPFNNTLSDYINWATTTVIKIAKKIFFYIGSFFTTKPLLEIKDLRNVLKQKQDVTTFQTAWQEKQHSKANTETPPLQKRFFHQEALSKFSNFFKQFLPNYLLATVEDQGKESILKFISKVFTTIIVQKREDITAYLFEHLNQVSNTKNQKLLSALVNYLIISEEEKLEELTQIKQRIGDNLQDPMQTLDMLTIQTYLGQTEANHFAKEFIKKHLPRKMESGHFQQMLQNAIESTMQKFILEGFQDKQTSNLPPLVVFILQRIGVQVGRRIDQIFEQISIPKLIDEVVFVLNQSVLSLTESTEKVASTLLVHKEDKQKLFDETFKKTSGCHPVTAKILEADAEQNIRPFLQQIFKEFSEVLIEKILDHKTIENISSEILRYSGTLEEKAETDEFLAALVKTLLSNEHLSHDLICSSLQAVKPILKDSLGEFLQEFILSGVFSREKCYRYAVNNLAPFIYTQLQKNFIDFIVDHNFSEEHEQKKKVSISFTTLFYELFVAQKRLQNTEAQEKFLKEKLLAEFYKHASPKNKKELDDEEVREGLKKSYEDILEELNRQLVTDSFTQQEFIEAFKKSLRSEKEHELKNQYGDLVMNLLFGTSQLGITEWIKFFRLWNRLRDKFSFVMLSSLSFIRRAKDPNEVIQRLIFPLLNKLYDHDFLREVKENKEVKWDEADQKREVDRMIRHSAPQLYDFIVFNSPDILHQAGGVMAADWYFNLEKQMTSIFTTVLRDDLVLYNAGFQVVDVLIREMRRIK